MAGDKMRTLIPAEVIDDEYLLRYCTIEERLTYIYALNIVHETGVGRYSKPIEALRIGISIERLEEILEMFKERFVLFYYQGYILIPDHSPTICTTIPPSVLKQRAFEFLPAQVQDVFINHNSFMEKNISQNESIMIETMEG